MFLVYTCDANTHAHIQIIASDTFTHWQRNTHTRKHTERCLSLFQTASIDSSLWQENILYTETTLNAASTHKHERIRRSSIDTLHSVRAHTNTHPHNGKKLEIRRVHALACFIHVYKGTQHVYRMHLIWKTTRKTAQSSVRYKGERCNSNVVECKVFLVNERPFTFICTQSTCSNMHRSCIPSFTFILSCVGCFCRCCILRIASYIPQHRFDARFVGKGACILDVVIGETKECDNCTLNLNGFLFFQQTGTIDSYLKERFG